MNYKLKKNKAKLFLGMEVKLEQMKLEDGITVIEAESFEPEFSVGIVQEEGIVPMPVGEYVLEDGRILVVSVEGIIGEIKETEMETPEAEAESPEVVVNAEEAKPKRIVESVSKETFFSKEEVEAITFEIEQSYEAKLSALQSHIDGLMEAKEAKEVELSQEEAGAKPISFNPENKSNKVDFAYGQNRPETLLDKVLSKLSN